MQAGIPRCAYFIFGGSVPLVVVVVVLDSLGLCLILLATRPGQLVVPTLVRALSTGRMRRTMFVDRVPSRACCVVVSKPIDGVAGHSYAARSPTCVHNILNLPR